MEIWSVSWYTLHSTAFRLAQKIEKDGHRFDMIVAIARGGITIAHILSDFLKLPITTFTISSYQNMKQHQVPEIKFKLGDKLHNKHILLVDDVSDTGKTFKRGIQYLKELDAEKIKTASLFTKPWTTFIPDFFEKEFNGWIVFPYDMRETVESISSMMKKEKKTLKEIKEKLAKIKVPEVLIKNYLK